MSVLWTSLTCHFLVPRYLRVGQLHTSRTTEDSSTVLVLRTHWTNCHHSIRISYLGAIIRGLIVPYCTAVVCVLLFSAGRLLFVSYCSLLYDCCLFAQPPRIWTLWRLAWNLLSYIHMLKKWDFGLERSVHGRLVCLFYCLLFLAIPQPRILATTYSRLFWASIWPDSPVTGRKGLANLWGSYWWMLWIAHWSATAVRELDQAPSCYI